MPIEWSPGEFLTWETNDGVSWGPYQRAGKVMFPSLVIVE